MPEWIVKYWVQWLFGLIIAALSGICRKLWVLYKNTKKQQKTEEHDEIRQEIKKSFAALREEMKNKDLEMQQEVQVIKDGVLNMQSKQFMASCHDFIERDHPITLKEFEDLQNDHRIYNSLGGNHDGDELYRIAYEKATA